MTGADRAAERTTGHRLLTLFGGIRPYDRTWLSRDMAAGVTLAALAIPEVMGYTRIAGTPVITGLYTILLPAICFAILGSSRHLVVGGDSATAAIMFAGIAGLGISGLRPDTPQWLALASLSALVTSSFLLLARFARLGFLADFISRTVLVGFLTGVGIQVAAGQIGGMLGVPAPNVGARHASGTLLKLWDTLGEIGQVSLPTVAVSVGVLVVLIVFGRWVKVIPAGLVAVVGAIVVSYVADLGAHGVATLGHVPSGLPHFGLPSGVSWTQAAALATTSISMVLVILAQSAATSRAFAVKYEEPLAENDDLIGLSFANLAAGLSSTFVVNGSPTKTEMVDEARSRTQVAQLTTAAMVVVVLLFLTKPLQYLPNAVLSAVVFLIGIRLIAVAQMRDIWSLRRDEFWVAAVTVVVVVVVGVEEGIILAIVLSIALHVRRHYTPQDTIIGWDAEGVPFERRPAPGRESEPGLIVYRFGVGLFYANAARFSKEVTALIDAPSPPRWFVLLAEAVDDIDYTGGKTLGELADELHSRNVVFAIAEAGPDVLRELRRFGITEKIGEDRVFETLEEARAAFHATARSDPGNG